MINLHDVENLESVNRVIYTYMPKFTLTFCQSFWLQTLIYYGRISKWPMNTIHMHIASSNFFFGSPWFNNYYGSKVIQQREKCKGTNGDIKKERMGWKQENVKGWNVWRNDKSCKIFSLWTLPCCSPCLSCSQM
jgi:hypothetical protein